MDKKDILGLYRCIDYIRAEERFETQRALDGILHPNKQKIAKDFEMICVDSKWKKDKAISRIAALKMDKNLTKTKRLT